MSLKIDWKRFARLGSVAIASLLLVALTSTIAFAWYYAYAVLHPGCQGDRASLAGAGFEAEAVEFPSRDGPVLRGWYTEGSCYPESAIIVLTGHAGNSAFAIPDATILAQAGYSTLIYEHRSCADPSLGASTGYTEAFDLLGAVDYLKNHPGVEHIGALGFSEGGTAIILAAAQESALEAVVPMGGYTSLRDDVLDPERALGPYARTFRQLLLWSISVQIGVPAEASSPIDVIDQISPRPLLLIYGEGEAAVGRALYEAAGEPKALWIVPGAGHGGYQEAAPGEYEQRILAFFQHAFGGLAP